jgi:predicted dehydrogenase
MPANMYWSRSPPISGWRTITRPWKRETGPGENDHYKPLAVALRKLLAEGAIGDMVFAHFTSIAKKFKTVGDWRNDAEMAGGDAFFEEGIHWLHLAGSLGPTITKIHGYRPRPAKENTTAGDRRLKSMMVAFQYDNTAAGSLYYSREIPSLLKGLRLSKLYGRKGIITFESNGLFILARGNGLPTLRLPGLRDIRGYQAMYRDFVRSIREGRSPEMSLERAMEDQRLMDQIYDCVEPATLRQVQGSPGPGRETPGSETSRAASRDERRA